MPIFTDWMGQFSWRSTSIGLIPNGHKFCSDHEFNRFTSERPTEISGRHKEATDQPVTQFNKRTIGSAMKSPLVWYNSYPRIPTLCVPPNVLSDPIEWCSLKDQRLPPKYQIKKGQTISAGMFRSSRAYLVAGSLNKGRPGTEHSWTMAERYELGKLCTKGRSFRLQ